MPKRPRPSAPSASAAARRRNVRSNVDESPTLRSPDKYTRVSVEQQIEEKKQSTVHLLLKTARLTNEYALRQVSRPAAVGGAIGPAHLALFPHIPWQGVRLTELAERIGTSKQAVGQLVDDLESAGIIARGPDPNDRRAKRIVFTSKGKTQILQGLELLLSVQAQFEREIGVQSVQALRKPLLKLLAFLQAADADDAGPGLTSATEHGRA